MYNNVYYITYILISNNIVHNNIYSKKTTLLLPIGFQNNYLDLSRLRNFCRNTISCTLFKKQGGAVPVLLITKYYIIFYIL